MYQKVPAAGKVTAQVFLVHFGGPFWKNKDNGAWHIPKGLIEPDENILVCAIREFCEETSFERGPLANSIFRDLGFVEYNNKKVYCFAFESDLPKDFVFKSNKISTRLPAGRQGWPENDRGQFFPIDEAMLKILPAQKVFLERLVNL